MQRLEAAGVLIGQRFEPGDIVLDLRRSGGPVTEPKVSDTPAGAEILVSTDRNMKELAGKILEVIRMLRAMGIRTVLTALGATGAVLGNLMIRREAKARVCLTGGEVEGMDLSRVFPGSRGLRVDQAPYKGAGFMGTPESAAGLFKNWRILPNQIRDITAAITLFHIIFWIATRLMG